MVVQHKSTTTLHHNYFTTSATKSRITKPPNEMHGIYNPYIVRNPLHSKLHACILRSQFQMHFSMMHFATRQIAHCFKRFAGGASLSVDSDEANADEDALLDTDDLSQKNKETKAN